MVSGSRAGVRVSALDLLFGAAERSAELDPFRSW